MANELRFNQSFYLSQNPDVAAAISRGQFANAEAHYNQFGRFEGRDPNAYFDTSYYLSQYPDVANARSNPLEHFLTYGAAEGRFANATEASAIDTNGNGFANEFNAATYLNSNADLKAAFGTDAVAALKHYQLFGQFESRPGVQLTNGTALTGPFTNTGTSPNTGTTTVFTTNIDTLTGTNGNDTFIGDNLTVSSADRVNGGAGVDTLVLSDTSTLPTLSNVERIELTNNTALRTVDVSGVTGLTEVALKGGITGSSITTAAGVVTTLDATVGAAGAAVTAVTVATAGTATGQTIQLTNGTNIATLTADGAAVNNLTLQSNGSAANTIGTLAGSAGATALTNSTLTIAGSQKLTITSALDTGFTTVNAAASTGGVSLTFDANAVTATGGSGNDRFAFAGNLGAGDTVVGGAGTDTIAITGSVLGAGATLTALNTKVSGFEVLEFTGSAATTITGGTAAGAFTNAEITKILFNTTGAGVLDTVENAGSARTYAFGESNLGAATLNGTAGVTTFNVSLEGVTGNGGNVGALTANFTNSGSTQVGTGTINIASIGTNDATNVNSTGVITGQSNGSALTSTSVVVTGSHDLTIDGLGTAGSINASAFTGKLVATGSAGQDVIIGGAGADTINATAGGDTYTGGAGADTFSFSNINQGSRATLTTISDFVSGTDKLDVNGLNGAGSAFNATAINVTAAPDFTGALNLASAAAANGTTSYFQFGGDTYVVVDNNNASASFDVATDAVVRLTGLVTLTANDVVVA